MNKLSWKSKISYSFGDIGSCLMNYMISFYLSFYCTVFLEIPIAVVGAMFLLVQIWDAVNDIMIGNLIDKTRTKEGKTRPWIKWFMIPCCISASLIFACPLSFPLTAKIIWVGVAYFVFVFFFTAVNLPYASLISYMTKDSSERATLGTSRYIGAYLGIIIVSSGALPLVKIIGGDDARAGAYRIVMLLFSVLALIMFYFLHKNCVEVDCGDNYPAKESKNRESVVDNKVSVKEFLGNLKLLFLNKPWFLVFLVCVLYWVRYPFYGTGMTYYYRFYLGLDETLSSVPFTAGNFAGIVVLPFIPKFVEKFGYKKPLIFSCIACGTAMLVGFFVKENVTAAVVCLVINMAMETFQLSITLSMLADAIDYGALKFGKRLNGLGFAANTFTSKAGPAFGGFLLSVCLTMTGLNTTAELGTVQSSTAINGLRVAFWLIPAVASFLMAFFSQKYPLNKEEHEKIVEELERRDQNG